MKLIVPVSMAAALAVFIQLILGGLVTFGFLPNSSFHQAFGYLAGVLVLISFVLAFVTRPRDIGLVGVTVIALVLIVVQGVLGIYVASTPSNQGLAFGHFVNGIVVFGLMVASTFYSVRVSRLSGMKVPTPQTTQGKPQPSALP